MPFLKLPSVFTDHAVLQHSRAVPVWGWTAPGTTVSVHFRSSHHTAVADESGKFMLRIDTGSPGGPFELVIHAGDEVRVVHDVLVGEVWLCSGQSNMEWPLRQSDGAEHDIPQFRHSTIRLLNVPQMARLEPADDILGRWTCCSPETIASFSGVAAHFGKRLHDELHVPIGLIQSALGGTAAELWTSREALKSVPELAYLAEKQTGSVPHIDEGIDAAAANWMDPELDTSDWKEMDIPQPWEQAGLEIDGAVWFRKTIVIPDRWAGKDLLLSIDIADDFDITFFGGLEVGRTDTDTPSWWNLSRKYTVAGSTVKPGATTIAVRVFDRWGNGGLLGKAERMYIAPADDEQDRIPLAGRWLFKVEKALEPRSAGALACSSLYNGMIVPLAPFSIAGVIWYQGESNRERAYEYRTLFPTMIRCWRELWKDQFPFLYVLLAGYRAHPSDPDESQIAELRDAQLSACALPGTAAVSAVDLGDAQDIHPRNKRDVGHRLALAALARVYGKDIVHQGPVFRSAQLQGETATLRFDNADGLHARGDRPMGFAVAGDDGVFQWAECQIVGETVVLKSRSGQDIKWIRYSWSDNPLGNIYNAAGLPMLPFRTDDRPYITAPVVEEYGRLG